MIDWTNENDNITAHFTVRDALLLHSYNRLANESDGLTEEGKDSLVKLCEKMEEIRDLLDCPVSVHCMFRSQEYNKTIGAIPNDVHAQFLACDFDCNKNMTCDEVKAKLLPELETLGIRMENNGQGAAWIHIDLHPVMHNRYFTP